MIVITDLAKLHATADEELLEHDPVLAHLSSGDADACVRK